jgi:hypothetical protein
MTRGRRDEAKQDFAEVAALVSTGGTVFWAAALLGLVREPVRRQSREFMSEDDVFKVAARLRDFRAETGPGALGKLT